MMHVRDLSTREAKLGRQAGQAKALSSPVFAPKAQTVFEMLVLHCPWLGRCVNKDSVRTYVPGLLQTLYHIFSVAFQDTLRTKPSEEVY